MSRVLVIEDNDTMREGMIQILQKMGLTVQSAADGQSGLNQMKKHAFDLVVTDYRMSGIDGLTVLDQVREQYPKTQVMMITAYGSIDLAVQAIQKGAADFITKPFSHDEFRIKVAKILQKIEQDEKLNRLSEENLYLREELDDQFNYGEIVGNSPKMKELYRTIAKVARTDSSIIVYGESGTGKELVARAIHKASDRNENPFIRVNCGALAEGVIESELFGHEKGAFTGAIRRKKGRFELADHGTIFLDEIGDLPLATQIKLLRILQEHEFERVGGEETLTVNVRIIAATNRDLDKLVEEKKFRQDLYYRLHIIPIYLPPLRERNEDIAVLTQFFLSRIGKTLNRPQLAITKNALQTLCSYPWPGNVRELENVLERSAVLAENEVISETDLPLLQPGLLDGNMDDGAFDLNHMLAQAEKKAIERALVKAGGNKTNTAKLLGIKTSALYYKLEKYGLL